MMITSVFSSQEESPPPKPIGNREDDVSCSSRGGRYRIVSFATRYMHMIMAIGMGILCCVVGFLLTNSLVVTGTFLIIALFSCLGGILLGLGIAVGVLIGSEQQVKQLNQSVRSSCDKNPDHRPEVQFWFDQLQLLQEKLDEQTLKFDQASLIWDSERALWKSIRLEMEEEIKSLRTELLHKDDSSLHMHMQERENLLDMLTMRTKELEHVEGLKSQLQKELALNQHQLQLMQRRLEEMACAHKEGMTHNIQIAQDAREHLLQMEEAYQQLQSRYKQVLATLEIREQMISVLRSYPASRPALGDSE